MTAATGNPLDDSKLTGFHIRLSIYSAGGPFLDGYILSIIGIALVQLTTQMHLSTTWAGLIGASSLIGIFVGGIAFGYVTDLIGRQVMYTIDLVAIIVCSVLQFFVVNDVQLFILRLIIGIAIGADYPIATSLLAEFLPRKHRGPLLGALVSMWFIGASVAYFVGYGLLFVGPDGWRWMLLSAAFPTLVIVLLRLGTPESPRWLMNKGRVEEARAVMRKVYGPDADVDQIPPEPEKTRFMKVFEPPYLRRTIYIAAFWTCSVVPLFAIYAFGPRILATFKLTGNEANIGSALISVLFLIGTLLALPTLNRLGRRRMIIWSFFISAFGLLFLGLFPGMSIWGIVLCFVVYAIFIGGPQVMQWIAPNELFPTDVRATAVGIGTGVSRVGAAIGTYLLPVSLDHLGIGWTMIIAAIITYLGALACYLWAPETKGLTLAEAAGGTASAQVISP